MFNLFTEGTAMKRILFALLLSAFALVASAQQAVQGTLLPSAAYTATANSTDRDNPGNRGIIVMLTFSSYTSGTWTPVVQGKNPITGSYYTIFSGAGISATPSTQPVVIRIYPGISETANVASSQPIPKTWRLQMLGGSTPISTFSAAFFSVP